MLRLTVVLLLVAAVPPPALGAQTRASTAELSGRVTDETGGVLPGATITAIHLATAVPRAAVSDADGRFTLAGLPIGAYDVRVELPSFRPRSVSDLHLRVGDRLDLDLVLTLAPVAEEITVQGTADVGDPRQAAVAAVVGDQQIARLPTNGRNFLSFAQLTPGVAPAWGAAAQETSGLSFVGQRGRANSIAVDGLDATDVNLGAVRATVSQDAAAEFRVLTSGYSAEFGKAGGGLVNIVTRSGTNTPSGSAFVYGRDDALNGREYFENHDAAGMPRRIGKAPFDQQQFGGTFGAPLQRDRLFMFASVERQRTRGSRFVGIDDTTPISHPFLPVVIGTPAGILRDAGLPLENGHQPYEVSSTLWLARLDHYAGRQWLALRASGGDRRNDNVEPFGGLVDRSRGYRLESDDVQVAGWWTTAPSDAWLHDLRVQFGRTVSVEQGFDPRCDSACDRDDEGGPAVDVLGVASVGRAAGTPASSDVRYLQVLDTVSRFGARHDLRAGLDVGLRRFTDNHFPLNAGGRFVFADLPAPIAALYGLPAPVSAIQAVAIGLPVVYIRGYGLGDAGESSNWDASVFLQDDWRVTPALTVSAGLRYQVQGFSTRRFDVPGVAGAYTFPSDLNNLAPRLAVAWETGGARPAVVRASYGITYERTLSGMDGSAAILNPNSGLRTLVALGALPIAAWNLPGRNLPEALVGPYASTTIAVDPSLRTPYAHHASVGIEQQLRPDLHASASAVFVEGRAQVGVLDYNPLVPSLGPGRRPDDIGGVPGSSGPVLQYTDFGESSYAGLLLSLSGRRGGRSSWLVSYTLARAEDNSTDFIVQAADPGRGRDPGSPDGLPLGFDPASEWGPSAQDQRHRLVSSGWHDLGAGFGVAGILTIGSGRPYNVTAGFDLNGDGAPESDRPLRSLVDPASSIGRNAGRLPVESSLDLRLSWRRAVGARAEVELLAEVFNVFNRVNVTAVNRIFGPGPYPGSPLPGYGLTTATAAPRQAQLAARIRF